MTAAQRALVDPPLIALAEPGFHLSALEYRALEKRREAFARQMSELHQRYDLLVTPQLATTAFATGHEVPPGTALERWWQWSPFTYPFNLTQQPAGTVPCGFASNGLPVAMQLVAARFADRTVLRAARAYERMHPIRTPPLPGRRPPAWHRILACSPQNAERRQWTSVKSGAWRRNSLPHASTTCARRASI